MESVTSRIFREPELCKKVPNALKSLIKVLIDGKQALTSFEDMDEAEIDLEA